jgi:hypothetical protein
MGPESIVERFFAQRVRQALGGITVKLAPTTKGIPDRLVILPGGRIYLVELKAPHGRVSLSQQSMHRLLANLGTEVAVLYTKNDVLDWIREKAEEGRRITTPRRRRKAPEEVTA